MAIEPRAPRLGPVNFNHRHGQNFVAPPHLIKRKAYGVGVDPSMLPDAEIDTSYDPTEILVTEPVPRVLPIFLGIRRALADRRTERSNDRLQDLAKEHQVLRYAGGAILTSNSYTHDKINGRPNRNRPSTPEEIRSVRKLHTIHGKRRRAGTRVHGTSSSATPPAYATWPESREAKKNRARHIDAQDKVSKHNEEFRTVIRKPARQAERVVRQRNRAVAKREALDQAAAWRAAKIRQVRDNLTGSAYALGDEIIDQHYDSLDMAKEQIERLRNSTAAQSGRLAVKGTVVLAKFYKETSKNAGKLYLQGGKHIARKVTRRGGTDNVVSDEVKSGGKELEESLKLSHDPRFNEELVSALRGPVSLAGSGEDVKITGYHGTEKVGDDMKHYVEYEDADGNKNFTTLDQLLWSHLPAKRQEEIRKAGLDPYALDGLFDPIFELPKDK